MAPQAPPAPPPQQPDADLVRIAMSPTWDDIMAVLRSDKMRGYRIDVETDATVMQDAEADKQSRIEFTKAAGELLTQAYQAMTVAPQVLPVIKEMFMFAIRGFHAGRSMEETFEDAFDELAKNPPPVAGKEEATIKDDPNGQIKIQLEAKKIAADQAAKQQDTQVKMAGVQADAQHNQGKLALEADKHKTDTAIKARELALQEQALELERQRHALAVAGHNRQLVTEATAPQEGAAPMAGPVPGPLEGLIAQMGQMVQVLAAGQQQTQQQLSALMQSIAAPKRIVRGSDGRALGVESVTVQ